MADIKLTDSELNTVTGGGNVNTNHKFPIGTQVLQNEFFEAYQGSENGEVTELLPDNYYRVKWDNGFDGYTYDENRITTMHMHWDIMYGA